MLLPLSLASRLRAGQCTRLLHVFGCPAKAGASWQSGGTGSNSDYPGMHKAGPAAFFTAAAVMNSERLRRTRPGRREPRAGNATEAEWRKALKHGLSAFAIPARRFPRFSTPRSRPAPPATELQQVPCRHVPTYLGGFHSGSDLPRPKPNREIGRFAGMDSGSPTNPTRIPSCGPACATFVDRWGISRDFGLDGP